LDALLVYSGVGYQKFGLLYTSKSHLPWGPPRLLYNGYWVTFPGVQRPGRGVDHPSPSRVEVKGRVDLCLYSPVGLRGLF